MILYKKRVRLINKKPNQKKSYNGIMKNSTGESLIALAGTLSIKLSSDMDIEEMIAFIEFLGLLKHNLEVIKTRRLLNKIEKVEKKIESRENKDNKEQKESKKSGQP